jgi:DNA-binding response OmpR family regulator
LQDRTSHKAIALVIEGNAMLRTVMAQQLRELSFAQVSQAPRIKDARLLIEQNSFDVILCNRDFEGHVSGGQDLIDELRREHLLPHSTVFIMLTSQAMYHHVVEAAEASLDSILLTPFTASMLADRLQEARRRKRELAGILEAMDRGNLESALNQATARWLAGSAYAHYCGRLTAELQLRLGRHAEARETFEKLAEKQKGSELAWCMLGLARCALAQGDATQSNKLIDKVLAADGNSADAHDLRGRILVEQCDLEGALASFLRSAELAPGCLLRAQHAGALAFYQDQPDLALKMLERTVGLGVKSKLFDALTLALIALLRFDKADLPGVTSSLSQLARYAERHPQSQRLNRLTTVARVLSLWMDGRVGEGMDTLREFSATVADDGFDLESANLLLGLWCRAPLSHYEPTEMEGVVARLGLRFCVSKAITEVMVASLRRMEFGVGVLMRSQARVAGLAEEAVGRALRGEPARAVAQLLEAGTETLNGKLLEMCVAMAKRHAKAVPNAPELAAKAQETLKRCCSSTTHIAGIQRTGRSPGGLQLRGRAASAPGDAQPTPVRDPLSV